MWGFDIRTFRLNFDWVNFKILSFINQFFSVVKAVRNNDGYRVGNFSFNLLWPVIKKILQLSPWPVHLSSMKFCKVKGLSTEHQYPQYIILCLENKFRNNKFAASLVIPTYISHLSAAGIDKEENLFARAVVFWVFFRLVCCVSGLSVTPASVQLLPVGGLEMLSFNL